MVVFVGTDREAPNYQRLSGIVMGALQAAVILTSSAKSGVSTLTTMVGR